MNSYDLMAPVTKGKIIPAAFKSIRHMTGSKMIDEQDKLIGPAIEEQITTKPRIKNQLVFATEKMDGMCAAIYRQDDKLYPLVRKGYDARTNPNQWIQAFGDYVSDNAETFMDLLSNGERVVGEWMLKQHTLQYRLTSPFLVFDIIRGTENNTYHLPWKSICELCELHNLDTPKCVMFGQTITVPKAIDACRETTPSVDGQPEGVVFRLEENGEFVCMAKFVSHPNVGKPEFFMAGNDTYGYNILPRKYAKYYPVLASIPELD